VIIPRAVRTNRRLERDLFSVVPLFLSLERTFRRAVAIIPRSVRTNRRLERDLFSVVLVFLSLERTFRRSVAIIPRSVRTNRRSERDRLSFVLLFLSLERTFRRPVAISPRAVRTNRRSERDRVSLVHVSRVSERTSVRLVRLRASSVRHLPRFVVADTRSVTLDGDGEADGAWSVCAELREGGSFGKPLREFVTGDRPFAGAGDVEGVGERDGLVRQQVLREGEPHGPAADDTVLDEVMHLARERRDGACPCRRERPARVWERGSSGRRAALWPLSHWPLASLPLAPSPSSRTRSHTRAPGRLDALDHWPHLALVHPRSGIRPECGSEAEA
jgi:hypothetical protein